MKLWGALLAAGLCACTGTPSTGQEAGPADSATVDAASDAGPDALADAVTPLDAAPDAGLEPAPEAGPDARVLETGPDACGECTVGTYRCAPGGGSVLQRCAAAAGCGVWSTYQDCAAPPDGATDTCTMGACARPYPGACIDTCSDGNCAPPRATGGNCVHAGWTTCTATGGCTMFWAVAICRFNEEAGAMICDVPGVRRCTSDVMCPGGSHCNLETGFCGE